MRTRLFWLAIVSLLLVSGCSKDRPPVAALTPLSTSAVAAWGIPEDLTVTGQGNSCRVVQGDSLQADAALELAAGGQGELAYNQEIIASPDATFNCRWQFLSTQGTGRIVLTALDNNDRTVATVGWVFTGRLPGDDSHEKWVDKRFVDNFRGGWLTINGSPAAMLSQYLPGVSLAEAAKFRLSVQIGHGQHALITAWHLAAPPPVKLVYQTTNFSVVKGDLVTLAVEVENTGTVRLSNITVEAVEPYGYGLTVVANRRQLVDHLNPSEKRRLTWQIRAQRPDAVNLGKPWPLSFAVNGMPVAARTFFAVADPRPGKIFYVMTEDLEPIDSAGYQVAWGNADGWLEPPELLTQMVTKAERLDNIADRYGAKWTHYIAWPVVNAAEWAQSQSSSGAWAQVVESIKQSVQQQSSRGHEYDVHLHSDYDPYLPGNVLSYNPAVDGFWANHLRHGWAHNLNTEGDFGAYASRTGMLYAYQAVLDELEANAPNGQLITARTGSFDFGNGSASEAMSIKAYRKVGLWGDSDADGNSGGVTAGDYGREIYWTKPDDINTPASDLGEVGVVEFRPTPQEFIAYDHQPALVMNKKVDQGMAYFAPGGTVRPGVHAIVGFTHAMFMMGSRDWQDTQNGQFAVLDEHLHYLKGQYADKGLLRFATASELVKAYLDYYAPCPVALYGPRLSDSFGVAEYPIIILGKDIPIDAAHPHTVRVKYPLYLRHSACRIAVIKNGETIYSTWGLPTPDNDVAFAVDDSQAEYQIKIYHNEYLFKCLTIWQKLRAKSAKIF